MTPLSLKDTIESVSTRVKVIEKGKQVVSTLTPTEYTTVIVNQTRPPGATKLIKDSPINYAAAVKSDSEATGDTWHLIEHRARKRQNEQPRSSGPNESKHKGITGQMKDTGLPTVEKKLQKHFCHKI